MYCFNLIETKSNFKTTFFLYKKKKKKREKPDMRSYDYIANSSEDKHEEINSCLSNKCTYLTVLVIQTNFILFV